MSNFCRDKELSFYLAFSGFRLRTACLKEHPTILSAKSHCLYPLMCILLRSAMSKDVCNHEISFPFMLESIVITGSRSPIFDLVRDLSRLSSSRSLTNDFICCDELLGLLLHHMPKKGNWAFRYSLNYPSFLSGSQEYFFICHFIKPANFQRFPEEPHLGGLQPISFCGNQGPILANIQC